jgi:hypothetical protein
MQDCKACSTSSVCTECYIGDAVVGGCTDVKGCVEVIHNFASGKPESICYICDASQFQEAPVNNTCMCL